MTFQEKSRELLNGAMQTLVLSLNLGLVYPSRVDVTSNVRLPVKA